MNKTNHKLEISEKGEQRVICVANGLWRLQQATGFVRDKGADDGSRNHCLAWNNKGPPSDYMEAKRNAGYELRERW